MSEYKRRRLSKDERQKIFGKTDGHCAYCGCEITIKEMQADHVCPLALGGADDLSNLLPSCRSCNHYKHTLTLEKFRACLERMPNVLMRDNVTYRIARRFGLVIPNPGKVIFYFEKMKSVIDGKESENDG